MPVVFISYRRRDTAFAAGRLRDRLVKAFGRKKVFIDVDWIDVGEDFRKAIDTAIGKCDVVLALIGPNWRIRAAADADDEHASREKEDFVRIEIATALRNHVRVVPILVDGAELPAPDELPEDLQELRNLNYLTIDHARFETAAGDLVRAIDNRSFWRRGVSFVPIWLIAAGLLAIGLLVLGVRVFRIGEQVAERAPVPLGPPVTKSVRSELIDRIVLNPPIVAPGERLTIIVLSNSSQVSAAGFFSFPGRPVASVDAVFRNEGIVIDYVVPQNAPLGPAKARVVIRKLRGQQEETHEVPYEIRKRPAGARGSQKTGPPSFERMSFTPIPAGTLTMGSVPGWLRMGLVDDGQRERRWIDRDEQPVHKIAVRGFLMMDHELTFGELKTILAHEPGVLQRPITTTLPDGSMAVGDPAASQVEASSPVLWEEIPVSVSFTEAEAVAKAFSRVWRRSIRLPTEAEWEYAARGGLEGKNFPWGNYNDTFRGVPVASLVDATRRRCAGLATFNPMRVHPVKSLTPGNGYGLYDVAGNVWEWTASPYVPYPLHTVSPEDAARFGVVIRGGGGIHQEACRIEVSFRGYAQTGTAKTYGLRLVADTADSGSVVVGDLAAGHAEGPVRRALSASHAVQNVTPKPSVLSLLTRLKERVRVSAALHDVPEVAVAGVIAAEHTLNMGLKDVAEDMLLSTWLRVNTDAWWYEWAERGANQAGTSETARMLANKWPAGLISTGFVVSFGPAQLTPRTVLRACRAASHPRFPCDDSVKTTLGRMLDEGSAVDLVALVLNFEAAAWERGAGYSIRNDAAMLGTVYSMGADYCLRRWGGTARHAVPNPFGRWIEAHATAIRRAIAPIP